MSSTKAPVWSTTYSYTFSDVIADEEWNLVVLHQVSSLSCLYSSIAPYLSNFISLIKTQYSTEHGRAYSGKFGWMVIPSFAEGTRGIFGNYVAEVNKLEELSTSMGLDHTMSSDEHAKRILEVAQRVMKNDDMSVLLPCGVAIQMARKTVLSRFGEWAPTDADGGMFMFKDGHHLQMGIANLIESWAIAMTLLNGQCKTGLVDGSQWPSGDLMTSTTAVGMDYNSQMLAVQCVQDALKTNYLGRPPISGKVGFRVYQSVAAMNADASNYAQDETMIAYCDGSFYILNTLNQEWNGFSS